MAYELIDEGKYRARAKAAEFGVNKNGNEYVLIAFLLSDGRRITDRFYLTDSAAPRTIEGMRYCGCTFPGADATNLEGLGSQECQLVIEHEKNEGKTYHRVKWINSLGGMKAEERMDGGRKKAFAARLKGLVLATDHKSPAGPGARSKPLDDSPEGNPGINDSDIPF